MKMLTKDLEDMTEVDLLNMKEKIDRVLFERRKVQDINNLKRKIEFLERQDFEMQNKTEDFEEFDYTHR
jgi:hypothetical protein